MMPTFGPVAMAGNAPQLPDDTRQRSIRILLMPDSEGTIQESDWEEIAPRAADLQALIAEVMESARDSIKQHKPIVPADCKGRMKEKWGPLARIAQVAGGDWPKKVEDLIMDDLEEQRLEREDGIEKRPAGVVLLDDLARIWPEESRFVRTPDLIRYLISCRPDYWGESSSFGKALTSQRLGRLLTQAAKIHSTKLDGARGYTKESFAYVWRRMGITPGKQTVQTVHTVQTDSPSDLFADGPDAA